MNFSPFPLASGQSVLVMKTASFFIEIKYKPPICQIFIDVVRNTPLLYIISSLSMKAKKGLH